MKLMGWLALAGWLWLVKETPQPHPMQPHVEQSNVPPNVTPK